MAYTLTGSIDLNTTLPAVDKTVVRVHGADAIVGWTDDTTLTRHYATPTWSGFATPNQSFSIQSGAAAVFQRKGRLFADTLAPGARSWLVVPYLTASAAGEAPQHLETRILEMTGANPTAGDAVQTHANAFAPGESGPKCFAMHAGVLAAYSVTNPNAALRLRGFSYSSEGGTALQSVDVDTTPGLTSTTYGVALPAGAAVTADKNTVYAASVDDDTTLRVRYVDMDVAGNAVAFSTVINTTLGLPSGVVAVRSTSVVTGPAGPVVGIVHEAASAAYLTLTNTDPGDFTAATHALVGVSTPVPAAGAGLYAYSPTLAFCQVPGASYIAEVSLPNLTLSINTADFTGASKVPVTINGQAVNLGVTLDSNAIYGMTLGNTNFGPDTALSALGVTARSVDRVRNTALNSVFWTAAVGGGGAQALSRYVLTEAPPTVRFEPDAAEFATWFTVTAGTANQNTNNSLYSTDFIPDGEAGQNAYYYTYDDGANYIGDGGSDMYDNGNYISFSGSGFITAPNVVYGSSDDQGTKGYYVSPSNYWPHSAFGWTKDAATITITVQGNLGSDGQGSRTQVTGTYTAPNTGRTGSYWAAMNYGQSNDPLIGDTFFTVESASWASDVTGSSVDLDIADKGAPTMVVSVTGSNFVLFHVLLSRWQSGQPSTPLSAALVEAILENYVDSMQGFGA